MLPCFSLLWTAHSIVAGLMGERANAGPGFWTQAWRVIVVEQGLIETRGVTGWIASLTEAILPKSGAIICDYIIATRRRCEDCRQGRMEFTGCRSGRLSSCYKRHGPTGLKARVFNVSQVGSRWLRDLLHIKEWKRAKKLIEGSPHQSLLEERDPLNTWVACNHLVVLVERLVNNIRSLDLSLLWSNISICSALQLPIVHWLQPPAQCEWTIISVVKHPALAETDFESR